jgi:chromatin segregation and condensation protein Rec8/ScpA/Scc1 (kleisin family)
MVSPFLNPPHLQLDAFSGPFDLLVQLLQKGEIPWQEIVLREVAYRFDEEAEVEARSAFLAHFVHLTWLKMQTFFPQEKGMLMEVEEGRSVLDDIAAFTTAVLFREALETQESISSLIHRRAPLPQLPPKKEIQGVELHQLENLFRNLINKSEVSLSLPQEIEEPLEVLLRDLLTKLDKPLSFQALFSSYERKHWVPLFLALLEGIKQTRITLANSNSDLEFARHKEFS